MHLIVGLGNPGRKYAGTRHNVGWWALDHLADVWRFSPWRAEGDALVADGEIPGVASRAAGVAADATTTGAAADAGAAPVKARLVKPQTYMNLSGAALRPYLRRLEWEGLQQLLVLVDEVALPVATLRLRAAGSAGGHNGLKSIEATLGTRDYARLRIGVGLANGDRPEGDLADFVLGEFRTEEREAILAQMPLLANVVALWAREGTAKAMNLANAAKAKSAEEDEKTRRREDEGGDKDRRRETGDGGVSATESR